MMVLVPGAGMPSLRVRSGSTNRCCHSHRDRCGLPLSRYPGVVVGHEHAADLVAVDHHADRPGRAVNPPGGRWSRRCCLNTSGPGHAGRVRLATEAHQRPPAPTSAPTGRSRTAHRPHRDDGAIVVIGLLAEPRPTRPSPPRAATSAGRRRGPGRPSRRRCRAGHRCHSTSAPAPRREPACWPAACGPGAVTMLGSASTADVATSTYFTAEFHRRRRRRIPARDLHNAKFASTTRLPTQIRRLALFPSSGTPAVNRRCPGRPTCDNATWVDHDVSASVRLELAISG